MKRLFSYIIALALVLSAVCTPVMAVYATDSVSVAYHEDAPLLGDSVAEDEDFSFPASTAKTYGGNTYYSKGKQLYEVFKAQLEKRSTAFTVYYLSKSSYRTQLQLVDLESELFKNATSDQLSTGSTDGDYLRWAKLGYGVSLSAAYREGYYFNVLHFQYQYLETPDEEKQVRSAIAKFIHSLDTDKLSDYEIIKAVHDYICSGTSYCYDALSGDIRDYAYAFSPYGALVKGSCVCQGYARAFYRICEELGYNCRVMTSLYSSSGGIFAIPNTGHAWNLVEVNGKYYFVDTTWDDELLDRGYPDRQYTFLLVNDATVKSLDSGKEHTPSYEYTENDFYNKKYAPFISAENYDRDAAQLSNCTVALSQNSFTYNGGKITPGVTVTAADGTMLSADDYSVSYVANTNTGIATVNISGKGEYAGSKTHRQFTISPQNMGKMWLQSGSKTTSSMTLCWNAKSGKPDGYYVEQYKDGKWQWIKTASGTSTKISSLSPATTYSFRVRAYKKQGSRTLYGGYGPVYQNTTLPKKPTLTLKTSKKTITASWKKLSATGYELQFATSSDFKKGVKKYTLKSKTTSKAFKKLKKGKRYYIRIRAYKTVGKNRYYSPWSKKSVICK